jgi:hypothetical protein
MSSLNFFLLSFFPIFRSWQLRRVAWNKDVIYFTRPGENKATDEINFAEIDQIISSFNPLTKVQLETLSNKARYTKQVECPLTTVSRRKQIAEENFAPGWHRQTRWDKFCLFGFKEEFTSPLQV